MVSKGRVAGKVALVTGAASGLGQAIAEHYVREGASVVVADVDGANGAAVAKGLGDKGLFIRHDVTDEKSWQAVIERTIAHFGRLDVLVNNAGITLMGSIEELSYADFNKMLNIDLGGVFLGCKHGVAAMKTTGGGSIINISSISGLRATGNLAGYNAAKGGVTLMTKSVAVHCAEKRYKIRCNSIHPGVIRTAILDKVMAQVPDPEALMAGFVAVHPIGHIGEPSDISNIAVYLASDESRFATGAAFVIDGGATI